MSEFNGSLHRPRQTNYEGLIDNLMRKGTPDRVYFMELFHDREVRDTIAERFNLTNGLDANASGFGRSKTIAVNRFCGWDYVVAGVSVDFQHHGATVDDTAAMARAGGRRYQDEHTGPIMSWEDFERYPWPDPSAAELSGDLEWFEENLPDDMCIIGGLTGHFAEELAWLMGYETLCYALYDQRDLVAAIAEKLLEIYRVCLGRMLEFDRVKAIWGSDDMGFKTGLLISPDDMRQFVLAGHKELADMAHEAGRPYLLHSCGNLGDIMDDLIDDVRIDAKHSFEDTIEDVREVKSTYGRRIALIGGIDVDFLCRADEQAIRRRVRDTLDSLPAGRRLLPGHGQQRGQLHPAGQLPGDDRRRDAVFIIKRVRPTGCPWREDRDDDPHSMPDRLHAGLAGIGPAFPSRGRARPQDVRGPLRGPQRGGLDRLHQPRRAQSVSRADGQDAGAPQVGALPDQAGGPALRRDQHAGEQRHLDRVQSGMSLSYHPAATWLIHHGYKIPRDFPSIMSLSVKTHVGDSYRHPFVIFHEIAHGYDYHFIGKGRDYGNDESQANYERMMKEGKYEKVLIWNGRVGSHYGRTNRMEYWAESTEAYFAVNDIYPFVRAELRQLDPQMARLVERYWGVDPNRWCDGEGPRGLPGSACERPPATVRQPRKRQPPQDHADRPLRQARHQGLDRLRLPGAGGSARPRGHTMYKILPVQAAHGQPLHRRGRVASSCTRSRSGWRSAAPAGRTCDTATAGKNWPPRALTPPSSGLWRSATRGA